MFRLKQNHFLFTLVAILATAPALLLGGTASAQPPRTVYIPPDVKGYRAVRMLQQAAFAPAQAYSHEPAPNHAASTAPQPVQLTLSFPNVPNTAFVAIRGPDGDVRYFPVEGGREGLRSRVIVVHPGERVHIQLPPANAR